LESYSHGIIKVITQSVPIGANENISVGKGKCPDQDLNHTAPEYKFIALPFCS